jgi:hypothetical protein
VPYDTGLADRLRAAALPAVRECDGWKSRGNSSGGNFYPKGMVVHHTAGAPPSAGKAPSLGIIINGRPDLPGPLANIYMDYEGTVYVVAAGAANHAGTPDGGSYKGMTGNSSAWGFEIEHPGTYALDDDRAEIAAAAVAAVIRGKAGASMCPYHKEWAPSRKIDLATSPGPNALRDRIAYYLSNPDATPGGGFLMALSDAEQNQLAEDAAKAKQFASGVQAYFEAFKKNGSQVDPPVKAPDSVNTEFEWAGWKLGDRLQNVACRQKDYMQGEEAKRDKAAGAPK